MRVSLLISLSLLMAVTRGAAQEKTYTSEQVARELEKRAETGDADIQCALGFHYSGFNLLTNLLKSVSTNHVKAAQWFLRAAKQGHPRAQLNMGNSYQWGFGVPVDGTQAYKWYAIAAGNDSPPEAEVARKALTDLEPKLTAEQAANGKTLAEQFVPQKETNPRAPTAPATKVPAEPEPESAPIIMTLAASVPGNLPIQVVQATNEFEAITIHSDVKVVGVLGATAQNQPIIQGVGTVAYAMAGPFSGKMTGRAGEPGTRLNIAPLAAHGVRLQFLGHEWEALDDKQAIILVTAKAIQVYRVAVHDESQQEAPAVGPSAADLKKPDSSQKQVVVGCFAFAVPSDWEVASGAQEAGAKREIEASVKQMLAAYGGAGSSQDLLGIQAFKAVRMPNQAGWFIAYTARIPPQQDYLATMEKDQKEKLSCGKQQGILTRVVEHGRQMMGDADVVKVHGETREGGRMMSVYYWAPSEPGLVGTISVVVNPGRFNEIKSALDATFESVRIHTAPK